jgi:tetratricopeptide (TPR) repeat protein
LGLLYYRNGQKANALAAWEHAVLLFPDYSNARWYLSLAYEERGELERALDQVIKIEPLNPDNEMVKIRIDQLKEGIQVIKPPEKDVLDANPLNNQEDRNSQ